MQNDTSITICNQALALIGGDPISSFEDGTRESALCELFYESTYQSCLQSRAWTFSISTKKLVPLDIGQRTDLVTYPFNLWVAYKLPDDFLRLKEIPYVNTSYEVSGSVLYIKYPFGLNELFIEYISNRVPESRLPANFVKYVARALAAELAVGLMSNTNLGEYWTDKAEKWRAKAGTIDSRNRGNIGIDYRKFDILTVRQ